MSISFLPTIENLPVPRNVRLRGPLPPQPAEDIDVQIQKAKQAAGVSSSNNNFDNNKQNQHHDDADDYNNSSEVSSSQKLLQQAEYRGDVETELFYDPACIDLLDCLDEKECLMAPVLHECVFAVNPASSSSSSSSSGNTNTSTNTSSNKKDSNNNNNNNDNNGENNYNSDNDNDNHNNKL